MHSFATKFTTALLVATSVMAAAEQAEQQPPLSAHQQLLSDLWDDHTKYEFSPDHKSTSDTMATMTSNPHVNHVPTMVGAVGGPAVAAFYEQHFIFANPDMNLSPVSRTIGSASLVDEMIISLVHDRPVPWLLPGVEPTGKKLEIGRAHV